MGLRVRKNFKLIPGVKLNLSKSGGSFSFGGKGFTVNVGKNGTRETIGLPGSGISYSKYQKRGGASSVLWTVLLVAISLVIYLLREGIITL